MRKTPRRTARYFAQEAYKLWVYNGIRKPGFNLAGPGHKSDYPGCVYVYLDANFTVLMRGNGAVMRTIKVED